MQKDMEGGGDGGKKQKRAALRMLFQEPVKGKRRQWQPEQRGRRRLGEQSRPSSEKEAGTNIALGSNSVKDAMPSPQEGNESSGEEGGGQRDKGGKKSGTPKD